MYVNYWLCSWLMTDSPSNCQNWWTLMDFQDESIHDEKFFPRKVRQVRHGEPFFLPNICTLTDISGQSINSWPDSQIDCFFFSPGSKQNAWCVTSQEATILHTVTSHTHHAMPPAFLPAWRYAYNYINIDIFGLELYYRSVARQPEIKTGDSLFISCIWEIYLAQKL